MSRPIAGVSSLDEQLSKREIQACSMLSHPNIVCYRNSFRHDGLLHLVFDFVCEGMVKVSRKRQGDWFVLPQSVRILTYDHTHVKPDNILIDENGDIKLCDFGISPPVCASKSLQDLLGDRPLPDGTLDFIANTLQLEPKLRLSAAQCLGHPFLRPLRDAELKDRETRRRARRSNRLNEDEGIEEDILGEQVQSHYVDSSSNEHKAEHKAAGADDNASPNKNGPRTFDFKHSDDGDTDKSDGKIASAKAKQRRRRFNNRNTNSGNNNIEYDSDDIQEDIEVEESDSKANSPSRQQCTSGDDDEGKSGCKPLHATPSRSKHATRQRSAAASAKHDGVDVDPLEGDSGYEDDFEEYHY
ncbi:hypothetical protein BBJ28_00007845 [Nothophytophthora sp. Chile5]|nr:hypothetical protein BBJ28_00007845 [Nothophytophthora sp. Chile5]